MPIDPYAALHALVRAEAVRRSAKPQPEPESAEEHQQTPPQEQEHE